jgi:hypothetical protein
MNDHVVTTIDPPSIVAKAWAVSLGTLALHMEKHVFNG